LSIIETNEIKVKPEAALPAARRLFLIIRYIHPIPLIVIYTRPPPSMKIKRGQMPPLNTPSFLLFCKPYPP